MRLFGEIIEDFWRIFEKFWRNWFVVRRLRTSINRRVLRPLWPPNIRALDVLVPGWTGHYVKRKPLTESVLVHCMMGISLGWPP